MLQSEESAFSPAQEAAFSTALWQHAPLRPAPLCPELSSWRAEDPVPLWQAVEQISGSTVDAPFYAVAWPGAQALARAVLDGQIDVKQKCVADIGCGSALASVAAIRMGAACAIGIDVDPWAILSARALMRAYDRDDRDVRDVRDVRGESSATAFSSSFIGRIGSPLADTLEAALLDQEADTFLIGDLVSSARHVAPVQAALQRWLREEKTLYFADSGRPFFLDAIKPIQHRLEEIGVWDVAVSSILDTNTSRTVRVWKLRNLV